MSYKRVQIRDDAAEALGKASVFFRKTGIRQIDFVSDAILSALENAEYENDVIVIKK